MYLLAAMAPVDSYFGHGSRGLSVGVLGLIGGLWGWMYHRESIARCGVGLSL